LQVFLQTLFIAVDDLRPELGCYGAEQIKSPNIDRLADRGFVFHRAYCQVAVCGASRASLLTGIRPADNRFRGYSARVDKDTPGAMTLPEELRKNGYYALSNGKVFHHNDDAAERSWSEPPWRPEMEGIDFLDPKSESLVGGKKNRGPVFESPDVPDSAYPDGQIANKTISDLKRLKEMDQPFFLACGFLKPHLPFYAPKKYWDLYDPAKIFLADNRYKPKNAPMKLNGSGEIHSYGNRNIEFNSDEWHRSCRHGYYACVSYVDAQIGRVLQTLDDLGLSDNTIVILWGDHGWHLGEHNFWGKHNVMHLASRTPMMICGPGITEKQTSDELVEFVDIYPTLVELAGISTENRDLQGVSFKPLLSDPDTPWKKAAFCRYGSAKSVITKRYNYAEFNNGERMLYDLKKDPDENMNIAENPENKKIIERLSALLNGDR
jgi:iduronate 2-sulfatase